MTYQQGLAIFGGSMAVPDGPPSWPPGDEGVQLALADVYQSGDWGRYHGARVEQLGRALSDLHGVPHTLTCSSGTIAVELALRGLKVGPGAPTIYDRLLSVNSAGTKIVMLIAVYGFLTGRPDFVDISLLYALMNYIATIAVLKFFEYDDLGSGAYQEDDI